MTVSELLERISSRELSEWQEYYKLEPFGQERDNLHAGIIATTVYNMFRDPKHGKTMKPGDFMLEFEPEVREPKTPTEIYGLFRTWAILRGGKGKKQ